ncbi:17176_t:CDS:2, partial [Racocetra persica]
KNWVLASLNPIYSQISLETWYFTPNNTNVSESSRLEDSKTFHTIETHNKSGIALHRSNHGIISRTKKSIKKTTQKVSKKRPSDEKSNSKPKVSAKKSRTASKNQDSSPNIDDDDLDKMERRIALQEREMTLKE